MSIKATSSACHGFMGCSECEDRVSQAVGGRSPHDFPDAHPRAVLVHTSRQDLVGRGARHAGVSDPDRGLRALHDAELEAATQGPDAALALIDQGLAIANETGEHLLDPYLHRLRGEILLKRDPANPTPAEEAFQAAISVAKRQGGCPQL